MTRVLIKGLIAQYAMTQRGDAQTRALGEVGRALGDLTLARLTPAAVAGYRRARKVSDSTIRRELGALVAVLNWSVRVKLVPASDVPHLVLPPPGQARELFMDEDQAEDFLDGAVRVRRLGAFVGLALLTGARKEAIRKLTWDRVDLAGRTIDYRVPGDAISKKRRVVVPINERLFEILRDMERSPGPYVVGSGSIRSVYERYTARVGMAWVTPHVLRHTAATLMLRRGVPLWAVAGVLGDSVQTITKTYAHHSTEHLREAVAALGVSQTRGNPDRAAQPSDSRHAG